MRRKSTIVMVMLLVNAILCFSLCILRVGCGKGLKSMEESDLGHPQARCDVPRRCGYDLSESADSDDLQSTLRDACTNACDRTMRDMLVHIEVSLGEVDAERRVE